MEVKIAENLDAVARVISQARSLLFITGAGISADSGVPTYRGIGGLYDVEMTEEGYPIEQILSGEMFNANPGLTWKYLLQIGNAAHGSRPNRAHEVIALLEQKLPRVWTLTQNVDGFHRCAGSQNLVEIHGNMSRLSCTRCANTMEVDEYAQVDSLPRCESCQSVLRPDVVLFGEALPAAAVNTLYQQLELGFDAVLSVGTSALFPYIRMPVTEARKAGIPTIEINPAETMITPDVDHYIPLGAAEALDRIWKKLN